VPIGERIADVERALAAGDADSDEDLVTAASSALKVLYGVAGRCAEVLALGRRDLEGLASVRSRLEQADILRTAAVNAIMIGGQFEDGLGLARRSHELSAGADPHQLMHATWPMLTALYHLGRWQELPPILDEHVDAFRQDPAPGCSFVRDGPVVGATVLAHTGELDRARTLAAVVGDPMADLDTASAWQARFAIASGDPEAARRISADKARERRLYGPQHVHALPEALVALEDWPGESPSSSPWHGPLWWGTRCSRPLATGPRGLPTSRLAGPARPPRRCAGRSPGSSGSASPSRRPGPASGWRRSSRPTPPGRCWRPPWRPTSGWAARPAGGPCGPGSARRPDRRGRGPRPTGPRSCG
jgi:hypothetical protein